MQFRTRKKRTLAQLPVFIPLFDAMTRQYGNLLSGVYGAVWRQCMMNRGLCHLPAYRLARLLRCTPQAVTRHLHQLVGDGYLEDLTPQAGRHPHVYRLTGRFHTSLELHLIDDDARPEAL